MYKRSNTILGYSKFANQTNDILVKHDLINPDDILKLNRMFQLCLAKEHKLTNIVAKAAWCDMPLQYNSKNVMPLNTGILKQWVKRLDRAKACFDDMQIEQNKHLELLYKNDIQKPAKERNYLNLTMFLLRFKDSIFTRKQMIDLLSHFPEVRNPAKRADKFKEKHGITYFSKNEIGLIIEILRKETESIANC